MKDKYFSLSQSNRLTRPPELLGLPDTYTYRVGKEQFEELDDLIVAYFYHQKKPEFGAVLHQPTYLLGDELKLLFSKYDPTLVCKGIQLYAMEEECHEHYLYWVPNFVQTSCLHGKAEFYPNGMCKKIRLKRFHIPDAPFFQLQDTLENKIIITLPVAESILRRHLYGIQLEEIEVI